MEIIKLTKDISFNVEGKKYELLKNKIYVVNNSVILGLYNYYGTNFFERVPHTEKPYKIDVKNSTPEELKDKKVIAFRSGGAGDLVFMVPSVKYLKDTYNINTSLVTSPPYIPIFWGSNLFSNIYPGILTYKEFKEFDYYISFAGKIEENKDAEKINAYDLFMQEFGIDYEKIDPKLKCPSIEPSKNSIEYWNNLMDIKPKSIAFQLRASSIVRTLPSSILADILKELVKNDYHIYLLDDARRYTDAVKFIKDFGLDSPNIHNVVNYSLDFNKMLALIKLCDMTIAPDSSGVHFAGCTDTPVIGLYGPFRSQLRLKYYNNAVGIDALPFRCGEGCFQHQNTLCQFANEMDMNIAPCWSLLDPIKVVEVVNTLYKKVGSKHDKSIHKILIKE